MSIRIAIRQETVTAVYLGRIGETAGLPEIYNIEADPRQKHNVGAENGGVIVPIYKS